MEEKPFVGPVFLLSIAILFNFLLSVVDSTFKSSCIEFGIYWDMITKIADDLIVNIERMRVNNRDRNIVTMYE